MDIIVTPNGPGRWTLVDLLDRQLGELTELAPADVRIKPGDRTAEALRDLKHGPYADLDTALSAIETHIRATCRMAVVDPGASRMEKDDAGD